MRLAQFLMLGAALALGACQSTDDTTAPSAGETALQAAVSEPAAQAAPTAENAIEAAMENPARSEANKARDIWRHPAETLDFFGLKPGMTVVEISPGGGYYAEILARFAKETGGTYVGTGKPVKAVADASVYGETTFTPFDAESGPLVEPGAADMVVTFRNIHNWMSREGMLDKAMADFAAALKPGGVLGVVEHRADPRPETVVDGVAARDGYVSTATVILAAEKAGLVLEAESEINANPKDTKDHPFGVWTLPPVARTSPFGEPANPDFDRAPYDAIGESDRMTLRFRKPE